MHYPAFFDDIPYITVYDPLAGFLGATTGGIIEYRYLDAVKLAGHSCPTVASAYWVSRLALRALYSDELPCRGGVRVEFSDSRESGTTGVMAHIVQLLTGASGDEGFKGLSGVFYRNGLMTFGVDGLRQIRFTQRETLRRVNVSIDLSKVPVSRELRALMNQCLGGNVDLETSQLFGDLWQDRVRRLILEHGEDREVFSVVQGR
mgnify:CR=1 FL=1